MFHIKLEIGRKTGGRGSKEPSREYWTNEKLRLLGFIAILALGALAIAKGVTNDPLVVAILAWMIQFVSGLGK